MKGNRLATLRTAAAVLLLAAGISILLGCPLRRLFGIGCPLCGMGRAGLRALSLDFAAAFRFHPLWPLVPPGLILWVHLERRRPGSGRAVWIPLLVLFAAVYVLRLWRQDPVVRPDFSAGLLSRLLALQHSCGAPVSPKG